ncbi:NAD(P)-dependent oxidoreductase [Pseudolysinimonas kribbensis]|uniref:UDP-glucose 4-epimerase n=1 Tax=Pseudolysinimonas kribbensis TaxID=433641 RepID=A0ABQ6K2Z2_9MICO|nr:NAD(P)-dependent oxidoreductase [Pseudolysinimonas kribbensis]GMA94995.1 UDP-glucose 4-epimerase [Pseudolysinimonas kribbensis]
MSRYLVTGGSGRLGRSVVDVLAEAGHDVVSVDRSPVAGLRAEQRQVDLLVPGAALDAVADIRPDGIVHLAAIAVPFSLPDPQIFAVNTTLAWVMREAALEIGVPSLLLASSPTVIGYGSPTGWVPSVLPIDERHPVAPWNGYALSKAAIESLVAMTVRQHGDRLRIAAFRPCYVIAPEEWAGTPTQQGHTIAERLADPELAAVSLFNYLDARDGGDFVLSWLRQAASVPNGGVFFVGAPDSLVREPVGQALARLVPEVADQARHLGDADAVFSSRLAEEVLGWRATRLWRDQLAERETEAGVA